MSPAERAETAVPQAGATADRRATRILATAEADRIRAHTEQVRTDTAERWRHQHAEAREQRASARRAARARTWTRRWSGVRAAAGVVVRSAPALAGVAACVAPTAIATRGQYEFGVEVMRLGAMAVLVPVMLEGAAWMLAWQRYQAVAAGDPATRLTVGVWALAGAAAGLNFWHGATGLGGSVQVGVTYGVASVVGFGLVELLARHRAGATPRAQQRRARRRLALARAVRFPRVSWAAWSRRVAHGAATDPEQVWRQVWESSTQASDGPVAPGPVEPVRTAAAAAVLPPAPASTDEPSERSERPEGHDTCSVTAQGDQLPEAAEPSRPGGGVGERAGRADRRRRADDVRVQDLAELLCAGAAVTGEQAGVIFGVSERTGRRLVAEAKTTCAQPPAAAAGAAGAAGDDDTRAASVSGAGEQHRLLQFPGAEPTPQAGVSA